MNEIRIKGIYGSLYISNNVIEKAIVFDNENNYYSETDLNVKLNEEGKIITKSGKVKVLTQSVYETIKPDKISITINKDGILVANHLNHRVLIDEYDTGFKTIVDSIEFIERYLNEDDTFIQRNIELFKTSPKTSRLEIKSGDIFRVPVKNKMFIYGRVITPLRESIKEDLPVTGNFDLSDWKVNVFDPNPFFIPLWVDFYLTKSDSPYLTNKELEKFNTSSSIIIGDFALRHSNYEIISKTKIDTSGIDVPMEVDSRYNYKPIFHYLNWGAGIVTLPINSELEKGITDDKLKNRQNMYSLRPSKKIEQFVDTSVNNEADFAIVDANRDLRSNRMRQIKLKLFELIGLEERVDYDVFARKYGFKTKLELIEMNK
ncbi:MAG: Imm26 family immunity protein [Chitinophagales bacterium]